MPIDDLFRNGLASGEEPMSETAWLNMERMLNGENPYADETSRKRRILPWLFGGGLVAMLTAGGWWLQHQSKSTSPVESIVSTTPNTSTAPNTSTSANLPAVAGSPRVTEAPESTLVEASEQASASAEMNAVPVSTGHVDGDASTETHGSSKNSKKLNKSGSKLAFVANKAKQKEGNNDSFNETENNTKNGLAQASEQAPSSPDTELNKPSKNRLKAKGDLRTATAKLNQDEQGSAQQGPIVLQAPTRVASPLAPQPVSSMNADVKPKQIMKVELTERVVRLRDGSVLNKGFDTLQISSSEEPTARALPRWMQPDADGKYHPRYVVLNDAQEAQAQQQRPLGSNTPSATDVTPSNTKANTTAAAPATLPLAKSVSEESSRGQQKEKSIDRLRTKAAILSADMASLSGKSCPGMSMGVHAAINNPKNNFGGFQFGLNNLKPFGDYFSLLAEVKFFIRNNSGYSIRDIMTSNKNLSMDTMSSPAQTIYSYQVDSMSHLYNFKRFAAIELPVVFQFHYRRLTAYAGLNMAYQFRIKTSNVQRNFVVNHNDTVSSQMPYSMPGELGQDVTKADFHARWGLGVVGGMSYSFNPQLYVDLRMVRNLSDNAQTLAARDVSANTFKVPSVQLSLGYRFRKFIPQQQ